MPRQHPVRYETLIAFAAGDPGLADAPGVAAHVASCPRCAATVARLRLVQETVRADAASAPSPAALVRVQDLAKGLGLPRIEPEQESPLAGVRRLVAALTFDGLAQPAVAGLRGAADGYQLAYAVEGVEVDLQVDPADGLSSEPGRWQVIGQLAGSSGLAGADVTLAPAGRDETLLRIETDDEGMFAFEVDSGAYDLLLRLPEGLLVLPRLDLRRQAGG